MLFKMPTPILRVNTRIALRQLQLNLSSPAPWGIGWHPVKLASRETCRIPQREHREIRERALTKDTQWLKKGWLDSDPLRKR